MPGNMAVHKPGARVVGLEGDGDVPVRWQQHDVPPGRVDEVERAEAGGRVECRAILGQQDNVHAVPVERVRNLITCANQILSLDLIGGITVVEMMVYLLWMMLVFAGKGMEVSFEASMTIKT